ncbi:MAG: pilus assembly protein, partial [Selenomonadaceae bacterium]|nr:pilus assembly protein [Selenomonadaceae bacterium]
MIRKFVNRNEKGAVIVFFAITLPLFLMLVGGAIDFGNAYIHKSRLQNTADAAVLAGAREFAVHGENDSIHPYADDEAARYVEHNAETANGSLPSTIKGKRYQAKQVDNVIYYRVLLTEEVPFYFLRILGDNFKSLDIQADAVAAISATSGSGEDVFIFSRDFSLVNTIANPDNFDEDG